MRQYDVFRNPSAESAHYAPYVVSLQSHYIDLDTVLVAPLVNDKIASNIEIAVEIEGQRLVLALTEMGSIRKAGLREPVGDLLGQEYEIQRGLDRLFKGF